MYLLLCLFSFFLSFFFYLNIGNFRSKKWLVCVWGPVYTNASSFENAYISMRFGLPSIPNTLSVFIENASIWKRSWKWIKRKTHTFRISVDGRWSIAGACVFSMRIEFCLRRNVQLYLFRTFNVDSRKRIKMVVWTRIDRCVFNGNENAYFWKPICVNKTEVKHAQRPKHILVLRTSH